MKWTVIFKAGDTSFRRKTFGRLEFVWSEDILGDVMFDQRNYGAVIWSTVDRLTSLLQYCVDQMFVDQMSVDQTT
jgi:hypothetical protein